MQAKALANGQRTQREPQDDLPTWVNPRLGAWICLASAALVLWGLWALWSAFEQS